MQTIKTVVEIDSAQGAFGFSYVREGFMDYLPAKRETLVYLRDGAGWTCRVLIMPAEQAVQMIGW